MTNGNQLITHPNFGVMPAEARNTKIDSTALGAAIQGSFPVLSYKGKSWAIRYHGQTYPIWQYDAQGRPIGTVPALELVIVNVSPTLAKTYYEGSYAEGSTEAPDCWSPNAITPDPGSPKIQSMSCATCPKNRFGSKITDNGSQSKACQDHKRIAVVPAGDMRNDRFGGPMLMRVPPASLTGLLDYSDRLAAVGWEWYALATQVSFDAEKAFPLIRFHEVRPLTADEIAYVHQLQDDPRVSRIINEGVEFEPLTPEQLAERGLNTSQPMQPPAQTVAPQQALPTHPAPAAAPQPAAAPAQPAGWGAPTPPMPQGNPANQPAGAIGGFGAPQSPPPQPAPAATVAPPPPPPVEQEYQYTPDRTHRWKAGMAAWEPVPGTPTPPAPQAPAEPAKAPRQRRARPGPVSPGPATTAQQGPTQPSQHMTNPAQPQGVPAGAFGGPPAAQSNGAGQPSSSAQSDPALQSFDDRLQKLL